MLPRLPETRVGSLSSRAGLLALTGLQEVGPALAGGDGVLRQTPVVQTPVRAK